MNEELFDGVLGYCYILVSSDVIIAITLQINQIVQIIIDVKILSLTF